jgi:uncharacterized protein
MTDLERTLADLVRNAYGYEIWEHHIAPMITIANEMAHLHEADAEVVRIAVLLHDLAGIEEFDKAKNHHVHGAEKARLLLREAEYPEEKTELVAQCILHHWVSVPMPKETAEEKCLADADAAAHISDLPSLFFEAFEEKGMEFEKGIHCVQRKIQKDWQRMSEMARMRYAQQYTEIMGIFARFLS